MVFMWNGPNGLPTMKTPMPARRPCAGGAYWPLKLRDLRRALQRPGLFDEFSVCVLFRWRFLFLLAERLQLKVQEVGEALLVFAVVGEIGGQFANVWQRFFRKLVGLAQFASFCVPNCESAHGDERMSMITAKSQRIYSDDFLQQ